MYTRKQAQHLANDVFWKRWIREYLPTLQERQKWITPRQNLKVDELVLIKDEDKPRGHWPLARVLEIEISADGRVRSARIKTATGELVRPITMICRLEKNYHYILGAECIILDVYRDDRDMLETCSSPGYNYRPGNGNKWQCPSYAQPKIYPLETEIYDNDPLMQPLKLLIKHMGLIFAGEPDDTAPHL